MLKKTIASAFKSKGKSKMDRSELTYTLSFDLNWFSHETSKEVVKLAEKRGLLKGNDELEPTFNLDEVEIPVDFKPDLEKIKRSDLFDELLEEISAKTGKDKQEIVSEINKMQMKLGNMLDILVVTILYAKQNGVNLSR